MNKQYSDERFEDKGRPRNGNPRFYELLNEMASTHDKKSHDYASNSNPSGNYHFAGQVANLFSHSPQDAGFVGRIAEKIYRIANLEGSGKVARNENLEDTERDIAVITLLWITDRRDRRKASEEVGATNACSATEAPPDDVTAMQLMLAINELCLRYLKGR